MTNQAPQDSHQALTSAIAAIKRGQPDEGRAKLQAVLDREPTNVAALLWMTKCFESPALKRAFFKQVLAIDPNNVHALKGLQVQGSVFTSDLTYGFETTPGILALLGAMGLAALAVFHKTLPGRLSSPFATILSALLALIVLPSWGLIRNEGDIVGVFVRQLGGVPPDRMWEEGAYGATITLLGLALVLLGGMMTNPRSHIPHPP